MVRAIFLMLALTALASFGLIQSIPNPPVYTAQSVVKVVLENGHGSGFYIGDGKIITAAHVVTNTNTVKIKTTDGRMIDGRVMWASESRDVAMISVNETALIAPANLSCKVRPIGTEIHSSGNPTFLEFITVWGRISSAVQKLGPWHKAYVVDMVVIPGQSGGPVFDMDGNIVGIAVGVFPYRSGFSVTLTGLGVVVPSSVICNLMGR